MKVHELKRGDWVVNSEGDIGEVDIDFTIAPRVRVWYDIGINGETYCSSYEIADFDLDEYLTRIDPAVADIIRGVEK